MSAYKNFVWEFPERCEGILRDLRRSHSHLDVTAALMVAGSALIVSWERLKEHPFADNICHQDAVESFQQLKKQSFLDLPLWATDPKSWCWGKISLQEIGLDADNWEDLQNPSPIISDVDIKHVLSTLRNALAHGNIITRGDLTIQEIVFVKENRDKSRRVDHYWFVSVAPQDFHLFLSNWFKWLKGIEMPRKIVEESIDIDRQAA